MTSTQLAKDYIDKCNNFLIKERVLKEAQKEWERTKDARDRAKEVLCKSVEGVKVFHLGSTFITVNKDDIDVQQAENVNPPKGVQVNGPDKP